jgi:hypothetical protein
VVTLILPPPANATATPYSDKSAFSLLLAHINGITSAAATEPLTETHTERQTDRLAMKLKPTLLMRGLQGQYAQNLSTTMAKSIPLKTTNSTVSFHTQTKNSPLLQFSEAPTP